MGICPECRTSHSKSGYCNDCLRIHRRENNDVNLLAWILDHNNRPCPLCLTLVEYTSEVELHHLYGTTWSNNSQQNNCTNVKLSEIKKWIILGKIPDNVVVMHKQCHSKLNFVDPYEVAHYYLNQLDSKCKLTYNVYEQAYRQYEVNPSLCEWEKRRVSLMGKFAKENYERNIQVLKEKFGLNFKSLIFP